MEADNGPNPQRFQGEFIQAEDGSGFTLLVDKKFFSYDKHKGWFDEYGNYYNRDGVPDDRPESQSDSDSYFSHSSGSSSDDYEKEFGEPRDLSCSSEQEEGRRHEHIAANLLALEQYPADRPLRVYFIDNMLKKEQLYVEVKSKINGLLNIVFQAGAQEGYFVVDCAATASHLLKLDGTKLATSQLILHIDSYQESLILPLRPQQLLYLPPQKYVVKNNLNQPNQIAISKPNPVWHSYTFSKKLFQNRTHFKRWMTDHGFNIQQDYGELQKIKNSQDLIQVKLTLQVFNTMNGKEYEGNIIEFHKAE